MMTIQKDKYKFVKYEKIYPELFRNEKAKLIKVLPKNISIEHVGSTAVPGLGGKGIIDIIIKTPKNKIDQFVKNLKSLGYEYNSEHQRDERRIFLQKKIISQGKEESIFILHLLKIFGTLLLHLETI